MALVYKLGVRVNDLENNINISSDAYSLYKIVVKHYRNLLRDEIKKYFAVDKELTGLRKMVKAGNKLLSGIFPVFKLLENYKDFYKDFVGSFKVDDLKKLVDNVDLRINRRGELYIGVDLYNIKMRKLAFYLEYGGVLLFYPRILSRVHRKVRNNLKMIKGRVE